MASRKPFPKNKTDFNKDERISFSRTTETYILEDPSDDSEWEWNETFKKWVPTMNEADIERQSQIYRIEGEEDEISAVDMNKKRKADDASAANKNKKVKSETVPAKQNTAIYVTGLPVDVTFEELNQRFKRYGVLKEALDSNAPRITMYRDADGKFKGEALFVYMRPESFMLAFKNCDGTDFTHDKRDPNGPIRIQQAQENYKNNGQDATEGTDAPKKRTGISKKKVIKKMEAMNRRLTDWDSDDEAGAKQQPNPRHKKMIVLKHMFTLKMLRDDKSIIEDIVQEVQVEAETFGEVAKVMLFDKEEDGIMTVRFRDTDAAAAFCKRQHGRIYEGLVVGAWCSDGTERFKKTRKVESEEEEEKRHEEYRKFIERVD